ncbi:hypothetical protein [Escherichia coli]|uniref:hypothetical protein n=1 Tax=Escherichia coli TaxID=562 RepID=UPI003A9844B7
MKAVFVFIEEVLFFNPFSSLAGDYTEVFEEKMVHFICVSRGGSILLMYQY